MTKVTIFSALVILAACLCRTQGFAYYWQSFPENSGFVKLRPVPGLSVVQSATDPNCDNKKESGQKNAGDSKEDSKAETGESESKETLSDKSGGKLTENSAEGSETSKKESSGEEDKEKRSSEESKETEGSAEVAEDSSELKSAEGSESNEDKEKSGEKEKEEEKEGEGEENKAEEMKKPGEKKKTKPIKISYTKYAGYSPVQSVVYSRPYPATYYRAYVPAVSPSISYLPLTAPNAAYLSSQRYLPVSVPRSYSTIVKGNGVNQGSVFQPGKLKEYVAPVPGANAKTIKIAAQPLQTIFSRQWQLAPPGGYQYAVL